MQRLSLVLCFLCASTFLACDDPQTTGGASLSCAMDSDCGGGYVCHPERNLCTLPDSISGGTEVQCGEGTILRDGVCALINTDAALPNCGVGTQLIDGVCEATQVDGGNTIECGQGTALVDGACVAADAGPAVACGAGTTLIDGACIAADGGAPVACGPGTTLVDGACIAADAGAPVACGPGTRLVNGACEPDIACGEGTALINGECVPEGSACLGDNDCPRGLYCIDGGCRERACEPSTRRCNGADLEVCNGSGLAWSFRRTCEFGCADEDCMPAPPVCEAGTRRCVGDSIETCDANGRGFAVVEVCETGCRAGQCLQAICAAGDRRCAGDEIETCDDDGMGFSFRRACPTGCAEGACLDPVCDPFSRRCNGLIPQECNARGSMWSDEAPCQSVCNEGVCDRLPPGACRPGATRCDGETLETCSDDFAWQPTRACDGACIGGECVPCLPGARRCENGRVEACGAAGEGFVLEADCEVGCVDARCTVCDPLTRRCNGDAIEVCSQDGQAFAPASLCLTACAAGSCTPCQPDAIRCNGRNVERCAPDGSAYGLVQACANQCRDGACIGEGICEAGARRCRGDEIEVCDGDGQAWRFRRLCETGCDDGDCLEQICEPFTRRCNGLLPQQCDARGSAYVDGAPCLRTCNDGLCDRIPPGGCEPQSTRCNGQTLEECNEFFAWQINQECAAACRDGACTACRPGARRCTAAGVEECVGDGSAYEVLEACDVGCIDNRCTQCVPADRRCRGDVIESCAADGQGWSPNSVCPTSCAEGQCTLCAPNAVRCNGFTVERCAADGESWMQQEQCGGRCDQGVCVGAAVCEPGTRRCDGVDRQICTPDAANWLTVESCIGACVDGACDGPSCLPFNLGGQPATLRNDGISSALVVSDIILDLNGNPVPDGTLFTVRVEGVDLLAEDGDPNSAGVQVRSLNGRIDFAVGAREVIAPITIDAFHPIAGRCGGSTTLEYGEVSNSLALDFTSRNGQDAENTTASWDTSLGRLDPFPSDFGQGQDGDLDTQDYNINQDAQPGRLFPDAVNFVVEAIGEASVTVAGGVGGVEIGDEVLLINLQGDLDNYENVGNYEIKEVARINYGENTLFFTTNIEKLYGLNEADNADLTGQKVMLQRVPRYRSLTVRGTMTADAWNGTKGGIFFVKVMGSTEVLGRIDMSDKGYRVAAKELPGESIGGFAERGGAANIGGGGGRGGGADRTSDDAGRFGPNNPGCNCEYYTLGTQYDDPHGGGGGGYGTAGSANGDAEPGNTYGDISLARWFMGSAGATTGSGHSRSRRYRYCCPLFWDPYVGEAPSQTIGSNGGGALSLWSGGISVRGEINANQENAGTMRGSGGSLFLRARSMNVGDGAVSANGGNGGGDGRIRLDYFGLAGTTSPEHHPGFAGDTVAMTNSLDRTERAITSATLERVVTDERGGNIAYQVTNDGGATWHDIAPGETVDFALGESDLRLRVTFSNDNLQPLTLNGLVLRYTEADPE